MLGSIVPLGEKKRKMSLYPPKNVSAAPLSAAAAGEIPAADLYMYPKGEK